MHKTISSTSQKRLKELLDYNSETGLFTWKIDRNHFAMKGDIAGSINKRTGYNNISVDNVRYKTHRLIWLYVYGVFPSDLVDHINGNRSDNRIDNLREATNLQNIRNRGVNKNNTSGFKGVSWRKDIGKWVVHAHLDGVIIHLGYYVDVNEASSVYNKFIKEHHEEFYRDTTKDLNKEIK